MQFSARGKKLTSSVIREILKVTEQPEVISFAGGLPSPDTFPSEQMRAAADRLLTHAPAASLQYGPTEGYAPLREWIADRHRQLGCEIRADQVLVTTGSQQALDLLGKVLCEPGRAALVESPTYLGAVQALSVFEPVFTQIASDNGGPLPQDLERVADSSASFLYLIPNFQNPTGRQIPLARRRDLVQVSESKDLLLVEDDPYGQLSYSGDMVPSLLSLNPRQVVHVSSFSKVLAPGLRVGYVIAPLDLNRKLVQAKQAADLHTPSFTQRLVHEVIKDGFLTSHIPTIRALYASRCNVMLDALSRHFPPEAQWNRPAGGMFVWVKLPAGFDCDELLSEAVEAKVAFVPGSSFYVKDPAINTMRLSFVTVSPDKIEEGIARLGRLVKERLARSPIPQARAG
jgi:2-aminoadipate transaminase